MKTSIKLIAVAILLSPVLSFGQNFKSDFQVSFNPISGTKSTHKNITIAFASKGAPPLQVINGIIVSSGIFIFYYDSNAYEAIKCQLLFKEEKDYGNYVQTNFEITGDWALDFSVLKVKKYKACDDSSTYCIKVNKSSYSMVFTLYNTVNLNGGHTIFYAN